MLFSENNDVSVSVKGFLFTTYVEAIVKHDWLHNI